MNCVFTKGSWQAEIQLASMVSFDSSTMLELNTRCSLGSVILPSRLETQIWKSLCVWKWIAICHFSISAVFITISIYYTERFWSYRIHVYKMYRGKCECVYTHIIIHNCVCIYVNVFRQVGLWGAGKLKVILWCLSLLCVFQYLTKDKSSNPSSILSCICFLQNFLEMKNWIDGGPLSFCWVWCRWNNGSKSYWNQIHWASTNWAGIVLPPWRTALMLSTLYT